MLNHQAHQGHQEPAHLDHLAREVVDSIYTVHKAIGPGLLENAYETFLLHELMERGIPVQSQYPVQVEYKNKVIDIGYRLDLLVDDQIIIELKTVERLLPVHEAQMLTYLKLAKRRLGFLVNFNNKLIKDGIKRYAL